MLEEVVFVLFALGGVQMDLQFSRAPNAWNLLFSSTAVFPVHARVRLDRDHGPGGQLRRVAMAGRGCEILRRALRVGLVFGMPAWFSTALFMSTDLVAFIPWWFNRGPSKYIRQPGAAFLVLAFIGIVAVDGFARAVQH